MKKFLYLSFILLGACTSSSILTPSERESVQALMNRPSRELIYARGLPDEKQHDDRVGEIWVYKYQVDKGPIGASPGSTYIKKLMFFVDNDTVRQCTVVRDDVAKDRTYVY